MTSKPFRIAVLGSGQGSNFAAIADACSSGEVPAHVALVISDAPQAGILDKARQRGIPSNYIAPGAFRTKLDEAAELNYVQALEVAQTDLLVLAGFMRVIRAPLLTAFAGRIVNIHPSLLPAFPGLQAWKQAFDYGVKVTGCTVHFVDAGVDSGPIIGQQTVPILDNDTPETLLERIHVAEHELYPRCVGAVARGQIALSGRRVIGRT